jgi:hypothetical protein
MMFLVLCGWMCLSCVVQVSEYTPDLSALDVAVRVLERQLLSIKAHLKDDAENLSKARVHFRF